MDPNTTAAMLQTVLPMIAIIAIMYFVMIRPQRKKEKELKAKLEKLKVGDKITTIGGICGKIHKIKDEFVVIETGSTGNPAEKAYIKMERTAINQIQSKSE